MTVTVVNVTVNQLSLKSCDSVWSLKRGEFHISHDASRLISIFSSRLIKRSRVSREIFNVLNFKMDLIKGKFQCALLIFGV